MMSPAKYLNLTESQVCTVKKVTRHSVEFAVLFILLGITAGWFFNEGVRSYNERAEAIKQINEAASSAQMSAQKADLLVGTLKPRFLCEWAMDTSTGGKHLVITDVTADTKPLLGVPKEEVIGKSPEIMIGDEELLKNHKMATTSSRLELDDEVSYQTVIRRLDDRNLRTPVLITVWALPHDRYAARIYSIGETYHVDNPPE